jgi:DNA repair ATPase RecN
MVGLPSITEAFMGTAYATYNDWNKVEQQLQRMWKAATTAARTEDIHGYTSWEVDRFQYGENSTLEPTTSSLSNDLMLRW